MTDQQPTNKERLQVIRDWMKSHGHQPSTLPIEELRARTRATIARLKSLNESLKLKKG